MRITALRPPPEGAPGESLAEGVAKVVCQVDGEPVGPAPCKPVKLSGPRGRGTDQDGARGFPSGPGASNSAPYIEAGDTIATGSAFTSATTLRAGLGPYTRVRIQLAHQRVSCLTHSPRRSANCRGRRDRRRETRQIPFAYLSGPRTAADRPRREPKMSGDIATAIRAEAEARVSLPRDSPLANGGTGAGRQRA
jgi:hypothetical protein